jgi:hypothetical protein
MTTSCKDCAFAEYEGITQTGCSKDRLRLFEDELVEAYDEEKEFNILRDTTCVYKRSQKWLDKALETETSVDERLVKETRLPYQVLMICNDSAEDCMKTYESFVKQTVLPWRFTFVRPYGGSLSLPDTISPQLKDRTKFQWRCQEILNPEFGEDQRMIDLALKYKPSLYYAVFRAGIEVPEDMFEIISNKVVQERFKFAALSPNGENQGLVVQHSVYQYTKMIMPKLSTLDALKELQCQEIYPITTIVPNFPS